MRNFQRLTTDLPVSALNAALLRHSNLWSEITARQEYEGSAHRHTQTIFLRWCEGQTIEAAFSEIRAIDYPACNKLPESFELAQMALRKIGTDSPKDLGRILITSLNPHGIISPHIDEGAYADHYERFHLVLESEPGNLFFCGDEVAQMKPGELWWFNHKKTHTVYNGSDRARVHMIIDCVAPDFRRERHALSA